MANWEKCQKHPGHKQFVSVQEFTESYLPQLQTTNQRSKLQAMIDLTVRVCVTWTSPARPDNDALASVRGFQLPRLGSGVIRGVSGPQHNKPCPCGECGGNGTRKYWRFVVRTARHVVFNTEEAQKTGLRFFYEDEICPSGGWTNVKGLEVVWSKHDMDICDISCVTHDQALGEKMAVLWRCLSGSEGASRDMSDLDLLPSCYNRPGHTALIVSHPHGQPKRITVGHAIDKEYPFLAYTACTCPGSSGAPVFLFRGKRYLPSYSPVHCGSYTSPENNGRLNYGNLW